MLHTIKTLIHTDNNITVQYVNNGQISHELNTNQGTIKSRGVASALYVS